MKYFHVKYLHVESPENRIDVFIRHAAGKLHLRLNGPITVAATYPIEEKENDAPDQDCGEGGAQHHI
jgi:hypothetical protein